MRVQHVSSILGSYPRSNVGNLANVTFKEFFGLKKYRKYMDSLLAKVTLPSQSLLSELSLCRGKFVLSGLEQKFALCFLRNTQERLIFLFT